MYLKLKLKKISAHVTKESTEFVQAADFNYNCKTIVVLVWTYLKILAWHGYYKVSFSFVTKIKTNIINCYLANSRYAQLSGELFSPSEKWKKNTSGPRLM